MHLIDGILIALMVIFAITGYRQGFVMGGLSFAGFFAGAVIGLQVGPLLARQFADGGARVLVALGVIFTLAVLGQTLAAWLGGRLRRSITDRTLRQVDDAGGALVSVVAVLLVAALVAIPLRSTSLPALNREIRASAILGAAQAVLPRETAALSAAMGATLDTNGSPGIFSGLVPAGAGEVAEPDSALGRAPIVRQVRRSVLKVHGYAPSCRRQIDGSGFVYAAEHVMTNAHVVAGAREVEVRTGTGALDGTVVLFDPDRDLAVLHVPGLRAPALTFAEEPAAPGAGAIVLGYPLGGPYNAQPARVADRAVRPGLDIYSTREDVEREMYTVKGLVRSGNSGGPLIAPDGRVLGVVFAAAKDDRYVGFALTAEEAASTAAQGKKRTRAVRTGDCA